MNKIILATLCLFLLITSCSKKDEPQPKIDSVLSETQENEYYQIWKSILLENSNMTDEYFNEHITNYTLSSYKWNGGISFKIDYIIRIDWVNIKSSNNFLVKMNSSYDAYRHLNIPRDIFFTKNQIKLNTYSDVHSEVDRHNPVNALKYKNSNEVYEAVVTSSGYNEVSLDYISYYVPGKLPRKDGDPYYILNGTISDSQNRCLTGYINLVTGDSEVWETTCRVN